MIVMIVMMKPIMSRTFYVLPKYFNTNTIINNTMMINTTMNYY